MNTKRFRVGQPVTFELGFRLVSGVVVEDRGPIGRGGRVLYRIEFRHEKSSSELAYIELPAEELSEAQAVSPA